MSMQPLDRPVGSSHILRYSGPVTIGVASGVYPKANAEIPSDSSVGPVVGVVPAGQFRAWVRFLLADATDPTDGQKSFPSFVFDDTMPAGDAPHVPTPSVITPTPGINPTDLDIGGRTWAPNLHVAVSALDPSVQAVDITDIRVILDSGVDSGLGLNTGLPVVVVGINVLVSGNVQLPLAPFEIDITFEIRHSVHR